MRLLSRLNPVLCPFYLAIQYAQMLTSVSIFLAHRSLFCSMKVQYHILIIVILSCLYTVYTIAVYATKGYEETDKVTAEKILAGKMLWQKHNCQSCHQLYGLGGYLGPDLTNCYSAPHKGPAYMDAILQSGIGIMPDFGLDSSERKSIICFLKQMDSTGFADPKKFKITIAGNIYPDEAK